MGLAAPQIGIGQRLAVVDVTVGKNPEAKIVLANPEIIHAEGEQREEEGCLSVPGFRGNVARPQYVTVRAQDVTGKTFEMNGEGLLARAFCHEIDHLDGVLFLQAPGTAQTRLDPPTNPQTAKSGRVVGAHAPKPRETSCASSSAARPNLPFPRCGRCWRTRISAWKRW